MHCIFLSTSILIEDLIRKGFDLSILPKWEKQSVMFAHRIRKNKKHLRKWAHRQGIHCYRLYDRDIPEIPLAIDLYEDRLYVSYYSSIRRFEEEELALWLPLMTEVLSTELGIPKEFIFCRQRERQKGSNQYERLEGLKRRFAVNEGGLQFLVNLTDYLDTGLFLDHRFTRAMFREDARGKRCLNLFAYTGSFSAYAIDGGARHCTTVDLSKNYLAWAKDNFSLNGQSLRNHTLVAADVSSFIKEEMKDRETYDLIVVDPPTFSNSKRMHGTFDVQRDHKWLLENLLRILAPMGKIYFSNNFRKFRLTDELEEKAVFKDISHQTLPKDFRNKKIHRCWTMEHR